MVMRKEEKWLELVHDKDEFKLYISKGTPTCFEMSREELVEFKNKINKALRAK
jgi:hypothetical protein